MGENQQISDLDKELDEINKLNAGYVDQDEPEEETPEPVPTPTEEPKEDPAKETPEDSEEDEEEDEPGKPDESDEDSEGKDDDDQDDDDDEDDEDDPDQGKPKPKRPERYIPIPKYKSEKAEWQKEKTELENKISELEKTGVDDTKAGSKAESDKVKSFAEKHGMTEDAVQDLVGLIREEAAPSDEIINEFKEMKQQRQEAQETQHFEQEFESDISPVLDKEFPNAGPKAKARAKELMDKLSHTKKYHTTSLDYVFFKERGQFEDILKASPSKKGPESAPSKGGTNKVLSAKDFKPKKDGQYDFSSLDGIDDPEQQNQIIKDLDPDAYMAYIAHVGSQDDGLEVSRGGRKIKLK